MKRKLFACILAGAMVLACGSSVMAEETEYSYDNYTYNDMAGAIEDGSWINMFDTFEIYLPSDWNIITDVDADETPEDNIYFQAANDDSTENVTVSFTSSDYTDIEDIASDCAAEDGYSNIDILNINGANCVRYIYETDGVWGAGIAALGDRGGVYTVTVACAADLEDEFSPVASDILMSFSPVEDTTEAAE